MSKQRTRADGAQVTADAPGRVNLLGEHTDYNDGFVLPTSIPQRTRVTLTRSATDAFRVRSADVVEQATFTLDRAPAPGFASYIYGCLRVVAERGVALPPLDIAIASDVPIGAGLSSSEAPVSSRSARSVATSSAALDDRPTPIGTSDSTWICSGGTSTPRACSSAMQP